MLDRTFEHLACGAEIEQELDSNRRPGLTPLAQRVPAGSRNPVPAARGSRWCRDAADAEDLVQDTLMRALATAHQCDPGSNLRAWPTTIMRNQFLTTAACSRRDKLAGGIGAHAQRPRRVYGPRAAAHLDVERAFKRLPESQRSAIVERTTG